MKNAINETYITNLCMYFHLLTKDEKINELKKLHSAHAIKADIAII